MFRLTNAEVTGILDRRTFRSTLQPDVNFLIGPNGTGKTTIINALRSAMQGDAEALASSNFESATLSFAKVDASSTGKLIVSKSDDYTRLHLIFEGSDFVDLEETFHTPRGFGRLIGTSLAPTESNVFKWLRSNLKMTWVSVHRYERTPKVSTAFDLAMPSEPSQLPIDARLDDIAARMTQYLAQRDRDAYRVLAAFQERFFVSLLDEPLDAKPASEEDVQLFAVRMAQVLTELVDHSKVQTPIIDHIRRVMAASRGLGSGAELTDSDRVTLANYARLQSILLDYENVERRRSEIYSGRDNLRRALWELFRGKTFAFDHRNQPLFLLDGDETRWVFPSTLSSGEKQMYIFLAETVLQEEQPCIYLADEPEISLHLAWQNALVRTIRTINPNAQIIFATHSPEILADYGDHAIDMETHTSVA